MKKNLLTHFLTLLFLLVSSDLLAQMKVTGTVLDGSNNEPLIGATVLEQGTSNGVTTDGNGRFSLSVKNRESVLTVSFVGMKTQHIMVGTNTDLSIVLQQDATQIEDVVVSIGYGDAQKKNVAGSLGVLSSKEIARSKGSSFMDALQGRIAGVQVSSSSGEPGAGIDITIRGGNSINAGTQPLYVIDDVQIDINEDEVATSSYTSANVRYNPLNGINPADIESITVLKDASATAIYGSRGANGVIIIRTRGGQGEKTSVDLDMSVGLAHISNTIPVLQGQEYAQYRFAQFPDSEVWGIDTNGDNRPDQVRDFSDYESRNWQEEVMRTGVIQNYNIGITSGGRSKTKVAASAGYLNQEGIVKRNQMERYTGRIRLDSDISDSFSTGGTINFSHIVTKGAVTNAGQNSYNGLVQSFVLYKPIFTGEDDDEASNPENYNLTNPVDFINDSYKSATQTRTMADIYVKYKPHKNWAIRLSGGGTILNSETDEWYPSTTSWGYSKNGLAVIARSGAESWQTSNTLTFAKLFGGKHYVNAVLGFELRSYTSKYLSTRAEGFDNQSFDGVFDIGQGNVFPDKVQTNKQRNTSESEFLRVNYTLSDKYIFNASVRRDGSSKFGRNNKYGYFPSAGFAWRVSKEEFMKRQRAIGELKLRLSYGVTGNDRIPAYQSLSRTDKTYYSGSDNSASLGLSPSEISNPELKWETTYQFNVGVDISLFRNRLNVEADFYKKRTKDMLLHADVPSQTGSYRQWQNIGQVDNTGVEFSINTVNISKRDFSWTTNINFNLNRNEIISLGSVSSIPVTVAGGHITEVGRVMVGQPIGVGWGYVFDGIYQEEDFDDEGNLKPGITSISGITVKPGDMKFKDLDGNNIVDPNADKTVVANSEPKFYGGITNTFTYKGFDLSFMFQGSYGSDIINIGRYRYEGFVSYNNVSEEYWRNRWTPENPSNRYPALKGQGKTEMSSYYVEDGSYLRLKNLTFGYTLPSRLARKLHLQSLRVYVAAENLFTWTNYSGYDPEVSFWNKLIPNLDYTNYPRSRTLFLGLSIKY